jgi:hypothetical protein
MTRNLKILGLAVVAAFVLSAVAASAASASKNYWFLSDAAAGKTTNITGEQTVASGDRMVFDAGTVKCNTTHYTGSQIGSTGSTLTLTASYGGCKFGSFHAVINMGNCDYLIHNDTNGDTTNGSFDSVTTITCTSGDITITVTLNGTVKCIIQIPAQNLGTGLVATNNPATGDILAHIDFSTITYTQTNATATGLGVCPGTPETHNGLYEGEATLTGFNESGGTTNISVG